MQRGSLEGALYAEGKHTESISLVGEARYNTATNTFTFVGERVIPPTALPQIGATIVLRPSRAPGSQQFAPLSATVKSIEQGKFGGVIYVCEPTTTAWG